MRVVGSLTTLPGRYNKLLRTLKSLNAQDTKLDEIYLTIPTTSKRLGIPYPELPKEIYNYCTVVNIDKDYGPITKIIGALIKESDPNTLIFTFDDDVVYATNLVSSMLKYHKKYPDDALGSTGFLFKYGFPFFMIISNCKQPWNALSGVILNENGRLVDALCGFSSVLYQRRFFPSMEQYLQYPLQNNDVYCNDDLMISAWISSIGINRRVVPNIPKPNKDKIYDSEVDLLDGNELSANKFAFMKKFRNALITLQNWGFYNEPEEVALEETIVGYTIVGVVLLFVIIVVSIIMFKYPSLLS